MRREISLLAIALLGGCAGPGLKSTLLPASAAPDFTSVAPATVTAGAAETQSARLQALLEQRLAGKDAGFPVQVGRSGESLVRVRMGADESFEAGTAQLQPRAMLVCSEIASALKGAPASVVHVLVHGADPGSEASTGLSARRAASVQSYLLARGLPATRVRAEGREGREPLSPNVEDAANWRVEMVIRPVIAGAEAQAWTPPALAACTGCGAKP